MFLRGFMKPRNHLFPVVFIPENLGLGVTERPRLLMASRVNTLSPTREGEQSSLTHARKIKRLAERQNLMTLEKCIKNLLIQWWRYYSKCLTSLIEQTKLDVHLDWLNCCNFKTTNDLVGRKQLESSPVFKWKTETQRSWINYSPIWCRPSSTMELLLIALLSPWERTPTGT